MGISKGDEWCRSCYNHTVRFDRSAIHVAPDFLQDRRSRSVHDQRTSVTRPAAHHNPGGMIMKTLKSKVAALALTTGVGIGVLATPCSAAGPNDGGRNGHGVTVSTCRRPVWPRASCTTTLVRR